MSSYAVAVDFLRSFVSSPFILRLFQCHTISQLNFPEGSAGVDHVYRVHPLFLEDDSVRDSLDEGCVLYEFSVGAVEC